MDGDGDGSSSSDVSSMAADEGPRADADPELTQPNASPPTDLYFTEEDALYRLYVCTRRRRRVQLDQDKEEEVEDEDDGAYDAFILDAVPASGVAIACLSETTVGEARESGDECAVCLDEYEAGDALRTMPCAHGFHERCIFSWLRLSCLCPLCRFALQAEVDTEIDDEEDRRDAGNDDDDDDGSALEYL